MVARKILTHKTGLAIDDDQKSEFLSLSFLRPVLYNPYLHISRQFLNLAEAVDAASERLRINPELFSAGSSKRRLNR